ncbi:hypothetical protein HBHAL_2267 [Halobacillus halophilus DSM 2266]|uniref:Uncharacterized protein n=1 Tax=Halobacillus halophilus (strain ATCC 35676 / DSM 2266 / JCM 20832 / KCTC 3685 / LMG 17431 / NBRC 102448 / NCIMB 2269) TaxID=866895 RepID=I0JKE9_HALH3|nr:hypothetical protein HBHAL_2267 [Halobacillus halophilus DSM 2266]
MEQAYFLLNKKSGKPCTGFAAFFGGFSTVLE